MLLEVMSGHANAKRAIKLAVAGNHKILALGPIGSGKDTLLRAFLELKKQADRGLLGKPDPEEAGASSIFSSPKPRDMVLGGLCNCGGGGARLCWCSPDELTLYARRLFEVSPDFDITVEVAEIPFQELLRTTQGTTATTADAVKQIFKVQEGLNGLDMSIEAIVKRLDAAGLRTLEIGQRTKGLGVGKLTSVLRVAQTITLMDSGQTTTIPGKAVAEGFQYQWIPNQEAAFRPLEPVPMPVLVMKKKGKRIE